MVTKVCLGILARNEAGNIAKLVSNLSRQTLMQNNELDVEIHLVANDCSDNTPVIARKAFEGEDFRSRNISIFIHELTRPGKSNAWNELIHCFLPDSTDYVFLIDADIDIPQDFALQTILDRLVETPTAVVAIDRSVKDISLSPPRSLSEFLIRAGTGTANDTSVAIAGALYCVRFAEVQKIRMPIGLPVEDGFLRAMLLTSSFSHEERVDRLVAVDEVYHVFESARDARTVFRHNVRLAIGIGINVLLFWHLRRLQAEGVELADYIQCRNMSDPDWINELVEERLRQRRYPMDAGFLSNRARVLRKKTLLKQVRSLPMLILGTTFDLFVYLRANALMRQGTGAGHW